MQSEVFAGLVSGVTRSALPPFVVDTRADQGRDRGRGRGRIRGRGRGRIRCRVQCRQARRASTFQPQNREALRAAASGRTSVVRRPRVIWGALVVAIRSVGRVVRALVVSECADPGRTVHADRK